MRQSLYSPRIPIVVTEREHGDWLMRQEAVGALQGENAGSEDAAASRLSLAER